MLRASRCEILLDAVLLELVILLPLMVGLADNVEVYLTPVVVHRLSQGRGIEISAGFSIRAGHLFAFTPLHVHCQPLQGNGVLQPLREGITPTPGKDKNRVREDTHYLGDAFFCLFIQLLLPSFPLDLSLF